MTYQINLSNLKLAKPELQQTLDELLSNADLNGEIGDRILEFRDLGHNNDFQWDNQNQQLVSDNLNSLRQLVCYIVWSEYSGSIEPDSQGQYPISEDYVFSLADSLPYLEK